ncbi:MAG: heme-binding protein [Acidimicrobiaceae bacterium]|nr:heme-binding protein [Acidimicrobiaceae bacterium]MBO0748480.1 heme-binding protein [Acidimicrobiaceae bacterium]
MSLTLDAARTIIATALTDAATRGLAPLAVVVLDAGGHLKAAERQDGASIHRTDIAHGKAYGAISMGLGSRALFKRAEAQPTFITAISATLGGRLVPVPGGVLVRDAAGELIGAVGVSGDVSDNDEAVAVAGITAAGLIADTG